MLIPEKGWLKVYLFYGILFFFLGLAGCFLKNNGEVSVSTMDYLQRVFSSFSLVENPDWLGNDPIIPAFSENSTGPEVVFLYPEHRHDPEGKLKRLVQVGSEELSDKYRKVRLIPVEEKRFDETLERLITQGNNQLLIGFKVTGSGNRFQLFLSASEPFFDQAWKTFLDGCVAIEFSKKGRPE